MKKCPYTFKISEIVYPNKVVYWVYGYCDGEAVWPLTLSFPSERNAKSYIDEYLTRWKNEQVVSTREYSYP